MNYIIYFLALFPCSTSLICKPFGTRLQYGQVLVNPSSQQKAVISFNTHDLCDSSFVKVKGSSGLHHVACKSNKVVGSKGMNYFTTYVQKCSLSQEILFGEQFFYKPYGWSGEEDEEEAGFDDYVEVTMVDPVNVRERVHVMVMADWGVIKERRYLPIQPTIKKAKKRFEFKLLLLAGDVAYDLDTQDGKKYIEFLKIKQNIFSHMPVVITPGNHEHYSEDDMMLLKSTFQLYNLSQNLAAGFRFADTYIVLFDPFNAVYKKGDQTKGLIALKQQLQIASNTNLFLIAVAHYPLICSQPKCQEIYNRTVDYFQAMIEHGVSLYLCGHSHLYERIYPYFANGTFQQIESPYRDDGGYLISVIEGAAGNDKYILQEMQERGNFSAKYTVNETGFGILTINFKEQIKFQHYARRRGFFDEIVIEKVKHNNKQQVTFERSKPKLRAEPPTV